MNRRKEDLTVICRDGRECRFRGIRGECMILLETYPPGKACPFRKKDWIDGEETEEPT